MFNLAIDSKLRGCEANRQHSLWTEMTKFLALLK